MLVVPPLERLAQRAAFLTPEGISTLENADHAVTIVTPTEPDVPVLLDGLDLSAQLTAFETHPSRSWARIQLFNVGEHVVESSKGVQAFAYGFDDHDAYTFGLGWSCPDCPTPPAPKECPPVP